MQGRRTTNRQRHRIRPPRRFNSDGRTVTPAQRARRRRTVSSNHRARQSHTRGRQGHKITRGPPHFVGRRRPTHNMRDTRRRRRHGVRRPRAFNSRIRHKVDTKRLHRHRNRRTNTRNHNRPIQNRLTSHFRKAQRVTREFRTKLTNLKTVDYKTSNFSTGDVKTVRNRLLSSSRMRPVVRTGQVSVWQKVSLAIVYFASG